VATYTESAWGSSNGVYPTSVLTKRWTTTNETTVQCTTLTEATSGYVFESEWSAGAIRGNTLDSVDGDANRDDAEVLVRARIGTADETFGVLLRGSGSASSEQMYLAYLDWSGFGSNFTLRVGRYVSGSFTLIASGNTISYTNDDWFFVRFRVNGTTLQARWWTQKEQEPAHWSIDTTDSNVTGVGWTGLFSSQANFNSEVDWISVGTNGDTAPYVADTTSTERITLSHAQTIYKATNPELRITTSQAQALFKATNPELRITTSQVQVLYTEPPFYARVTQAISEVLRDGSPKARVTQGTAEVLRDGTPKARVTQAIVEILRDIQAETPVDSDHIIPIAWRQGIASDQVIPFEWNEDFFSDSTILFDWWTPLNIDHLSPVEWTLDVNQDHAIPVSWRQGIAADSRAEVSWLQGIASDNQAPIIYGGEASSDAAMPFEWKAHLNIDRQIPFGWSTGIVPHDSAIPFAWRSGVASDHIPIFAWKGEPQPPPDSVIPYAWRGPFAGPGADLKIVFDWTLEFNNDSEPPTEWTLSIIENHQIPYDWLTETGLVTLHQMPISWSSFIDIDEQIPVSWSVELNFDHVIPYQWRLTIFLELDNQMPVSWKQQVNAAGSIPVNWNLELAPDHQIPFDWLAPALDSDQLIPIGYGTRLAVNTFTPVEWTVTLDQNANLPVEWRRDVGSFHSIPVTWASPAVSTSDFVPVEWKRTIDADHQIPYQWLTESFLFSDHRMLVEYQQIFFKRFDNVIPWEAQGIGERLFEAPIAWRGDPNALQRIPFEWTDPLFALFVEDPKLCELWVADCNGIKWDAQRVAAAWKTDQLPDEPVVYPDPGLDWESPPEEIGGAWFATDCGTQWSASKCKALWLADEPQVWHADCLESQWAAQTQPDRWTAVEQGTAWEVLEPNPR
jgi:hypothetical protein